MRVSPGGGPPARVGANAVTLLARPTGRAAAQVRRKVRYAAGVANEALSESVKRIIGRAKEGGVDAGYEGYRELFASPAFAGYGASDQRQALRLMVLMKGAPREPTAAMKEAHGAAAALLTSLVAAHAEPADHELLGMCYVVLGDEPKAGAVFRAGLELERARDPQSKLCGTLMKRVSMV
jgi:hypothetical protein